MSKEPEVGQMIEQWWATLSRSAVVILASPKTDTHSPNSRLVVMITLVFEGQGTDTDMISTEIDPMV